MSQSKAKLNKSLKKINQFIEDNKNEIAIHKAMLRIACIIKMQREKQGLSQRDLAEKTGLTQSTVLKIEKGKNTSLETLFKVAISMGLTPKIEFGV